MILRVILKPFVPWIFNLIPSEGASQALEKAVLSCLGRLARYLIDLKQTSRTVKINTTTQGINQYIHRSAVLLH